MATSSRDEAAPEHYINRDHTWLQYVFILTSVAMCITVDILQYSMPLSFLPSVLEDRGHSPMKIATAIGVYYWTGFLGGLIITSYQIWRVINGSSRDDRVTTVANAKRQIKY